MCLIKKEIDKHYSTTMKQTYDIVKLVDEALLGLLLFFRYWQKNKIKIKIYIKNKKTHDMATGLSE
jgi:hypothetical protein